MCCFCVAGHVVSLFRRAHSHRGPYTSHPLPAVSCFVPPPRGLSAGCVSCLRGRARRPHPPPHDRRGRRLGERLPHGPPPPFPPFPSLTACPSFRLCCYLAVCSTPLYTCRHHIASLTVPTDPRQMPLWLTLAWPCCVLCVCSARSEPFSRGDRTTSCRPWGVWTCGRPGGSAPSPYPAVRARVPLFSHSLSSLISPPCVVALCRYCHLTLTLRRHAIPPTPLSLSVCVCGVVRGCVAAVPPGGRRHLDRHRAAHRRCCDSVSL